MDSEPDAPGDTPVSFYLVAVLLAFVAVFGYALTFPVILHYRTKYAGRPGALLFRVLIASVIVIVVLAI